MGLKKGKVERSKIKASTNKAEILGLLANGNKRPLSGGGHKPGMSRTAAVGEESGRNRGNAHIDGGGTSRKLN